MQIKCNNYLIKIKVDRYRLQKIAKRKNKQFVY